MESDGCTFAPEFNVHDCCVSHDYDYAGGVIRIIADIKFFKCCWKKNKPVAVIYFLFVRCFGWYRYKKYSDMRSL